MIYNIFLLVIISIVVAFTNASTSSSIALSMYQTSVSQSRYLLNGWQATPSETITVGPLSISAITFAGNGTVRILVVNLATGFSRLVPVSPSSNPDDDPWQLESTSAAPGTQIQVTCAFESPSSSSSSTTSNSIFYFCFWDPISSTSTV